MASSDRDGYAGRVLGERYRLLTAIGQGASARVYVADDTRLGRHVAVKVLHQSLAADRGFMRVFEEEARAAAGLSHPHVLAVFDWGDDHGVPWIVTEYLGGGSLRRLLDRGHRLTPSQTLSVALQTARGLEYAHRAGFVHRDIKPANLIFGDEGRLRIADFGLARSLGDVEDSDITLVGTADRWVGTARYASPEQVDGGPVSGRSDVYALALVMVESITGDVPFVGSTLAETLNARLAGSVVAPPGLGPLAEVVAAAGSIDPEDRPDGRWLVEWLSELRPRLPRPSPLPLAGAIDESLDSPTAADDRTEIYPDGGPHPVVPAPGADDATEMGSRWAGPGAAERGDQTATVVAGGSGGGADTAWRHDEQEPVGDGAWADEAGNDQAWDDQAWDDEDGDDQDWDDEDWGETSGAGAYRRGPTVVVAVTVVVALLVVVALIVDVWRGLSL